MNLTNTEVFIVVFGALFLALATGVLAVDLALAGDWDQPSPLLAWARRTRRAALQLFTPKPRYTGRHVLTEYAPRHAVPSVRKVDAVFLVWKDLAVPVTGWHIVAYRPMEG